jgi:hypothetical protein
MIGSSSFLSRREFGASLGGFAMASRLFGAAASAPWMGPAVVKRVFLAVPTPTWPRPDLDVAAEQAAVEAALANLEKKHAGAVRFTGGDLVRTPEQAQAFVKSLTDEVDGVLIADLTSGTSGMLAALREIPAPVLLYARPYSGWSYVDVVRWAQQGRKADLVVTSEPGDLDPYLRIFRTIHHLRNSKVLVVSAGSGRNQAAEAFSKQFGTAFGFPTYGDLKAAFESADVKKAEAEAGKFAQEALKVVEPSAKDIADSMRLYHGILAVLEREKANAITVDCLGGFRRGDLPAYPCLAWSKLNDAGRYGVCEADVPSTMTQLLLTSFSGKPGFVSDPVFDTSRNEIIHAHCVSATALHGVGGAACPYIVRSHMEDNKGVSIQVLVPIQETVTCAKFLAPATLAVSTGEVLSNVDDARGCRTKFRTRVPDARKMLENFSGGLHRVVFYGDYIRPLEQMGRLMGFKVVREC